MTYDEWYTEWKEMLDEAMQALEAGLAVWMAEQWGE